MNGIVKLLSIAALFFAGVGLVFAQTSNDTIQEREIEEVVIVGFGQKKVISEVTGAVSTVRSEAIKQVPVASVDKMLQGRTTGVQTGSSSGQPVEWPV